MTPKFISMVTAVLVVISILISCKPSMKPETEKLTLTGNRDSTQLKFWKELVQLCGNAYEGTIISGPDNDTVFFGKKLVMHVRSCEETRIRIPFFVGEDSSRTWVLTLSESGLQLKHDHRYQDGTPDKVTMYGGMTSNYGAGDRQLFPADQETADLLPAAIGNIWWIDLVPGEYFSYNLRRVNTVRLFTVRFDFANSVAAPDKPWGWKD